MAGHPTIEITLCFWSTGDRERLDVYLDSLLGLLPEHHGQLIRRITATEASETEPEVLLVVGFPGSSAVDGFLNDPRRDDFEQLAKEAVSRSLLTGGTTRHQPPTLASLHQLPASEEPSVSADGRIKAGPSSIHGTGAFAVTPFQVGEHLGRYTGPATEKDGTHVLWVETDDGSFAGIDGDSVLRWINHSADPNVEFDGPDLYATRDIKPGEELTFNYGDDWKASVSTNDPSA